MMFRLNPAAGQPLYLQLIQQIKHAVETGMLQHGEALPGIRTLAEQLVVSHNTVAKAYSELQHEGVLELRHGSGAYVAARASTKTRADRVRLAQDAVRLMVKELRHDGFTEEEIQRLVQAELFYTPSTRELRTK